MDLKFESVEEVSEYGRKYQVAVMDPPWRYREKRTGGSLKSGSAQKYPTMSFEEIKALSISDIMQKNSVLYLWVTVPLKYEIVQVGLLEEWGFKYKTSLFWDKMSIKMGRYYRGQVEECWVATRGKIPAFLCQVSNIYRGKSEAHSKKPEGFFQEKIMPVVNKLDLHPRIEIFAREFREGWDVVGDGV